ncbi:hypothetical protein GCM10010531_15410 [Blastococcus jejuensis]|uniref:PPM-type phosphatase domain-containing protein n=1 Tax=Blastococcus jejuensis TaxID=351224 RepID=A0ABP6P348_9ACTN
MRTLRTAEKPRILQHEIPAFRGPSFSPSAQLLAAIVQGIRDGELEEDDVNASSTKSRNGATELPDLGSPLGPPAGTPTPQLFLSAAARSVAGPRPDNQDSGLTSATLLAVADGVGGHVGGATASALVVRSLADGRLTRVDGDPTVALERMVAAANQRMGDVCAEMPGLTGMATTLTAAVLSGDGRLGIAHIGDSRAYLLRRGRLVTLTRDHSVVQAMIDAGSLTADQAWTHPWRAVLLAALHGRDDDLAAVEFAAFRVVPGDRLLLCSDGLWGPLPEEPIRAGLVTAADPTSAARMLADAAVAARATDNVTVIVADVCDRMTMTAISVVGAAAAI